MLKRLLRRLVPWLGTVRASLSRRQITHLMVMRRQLGVATAVRLWAMRWYPWTRSDGIATLTLRGFSPSIAFRPRSSDPDVIVQVFSRREYEGVCQLEPVRRIIDCGANIGLASYYLLHAYKEARAVVVEPDAANMALCRRNLAVFGDRVRYVQAAVWPISAALKVRRGDDESAAWAFQVSPPAEGERPDVDGVTIAALMQTGGFDTVDLLKIDIEGAEGPLFDGGSVEWLTKTRNIAVEIHGEANRASIDAAMAPFGFDRRESGELTLFVDITQTQDTSVEWTSR